MLFKCEKQKERPHKLATSRDRGHFSWPLLHTAQMLFDVSQYPGDLGSG